MAGASVVLCADEFGLTEGVSHGILDLVGMQRVSAVSVLSQGAAWARLGPELAACRPGIGIGLHLDIAAGIGRSHTQTATEIARQIAMFCDVTGFTPDFISGRNNVHVLPHVRRGLFLALERTGLASQVWLRDPSERLPAIIRRGRAVSKALAANAMALGFARRARGRGIAVNDGFSGFSSYVRDYPVEREFQRFCQYLGPQPLIACRPGYIDDALERMGGVVESRSRELMYLSSTRFTDLLEVLGITLVASPVNRPPGLRPR
ncbi:MAG TPA: ChbG/HpnK family deacetylase [Saliniramus sp.]|nr:ChbG/HpnK family deacetylase [Saliniramus sp.]